MQLFIMNFITYISLDWSWWLSNIQNWKNMFFTWGICACCLQEYRNKQQQKQRQQQGPGSVGPPGLLIGPPGHGSNAPQQQSLVIHSPLGPPSSSPVHHPSAPQSPMMSPSPSPMMQQHSSPLHSPGPLLSHSPGPGSMLQHSPSNTGPSSNSCMSPHSLQASPRMGTPHSQVLVLHITVIYFEWYRAH